MQKVQPSADQHEWVHGTFGVDPLTYPNRPAASTDYTAATNPSRGGAALSSAANAPGTPAAGSPVAPKTAGTPVRAPGTPPSPPPDPEALIRQWLDRHQFAAPEQQPDGSDKPAEKGKQPPELHVLLNGEDMPLSAAIKAAVSDLQQPANLVQRVIEASLKPALPQSLADVAIVGPGNELPGLHLDPTKPGYSDPAIGKAVEMSSIDDFLKDHDFSAPAVRDPTGTHCLLDGKNTTIDAVADKAFALLGSYPYLKRNEVVAHVRQKYVAARGTDAATQIVFGYTFIPDKTQAAPSPKVTQHQFNFTITRQHHANDSAGPESSFQGTVTLDQDGKIMNLQAMGQEAVVKPLLEGWIQVSGLVQAGVSANWTKTMSGSSTVSGTWQIAAGGQVLITPAFKSGAFKFLNGHVQIGVQVLGGVQGPLPGQTGDPAVSGSVGGVLNIPFDVTDLFKK